LVSEAIIKGSQLLPGGQSKAEVIHRKNVQLERNEVDMLIGIGTKSSDWDRPRSRS
jgi:hypothetical protein